MATTEELLKQQTSTATSMPALSSSMSNEERINTINKIYDAQKEAQLGQLKTSYDQNVSEYKNAQNKLAPAYQVKANDLGVQYERNRRNFNQQAAGNGLNTGAGSQAALAQRSQYLRAFGNLRASEAEENAEYDRKLADLLTAYNTNVNTTGAQLEGNRNEALLNEYNNQYQKDLQKAQALAQFGDFSGYAAIYGDAAAKNMTKVWNFQNPEAAYNLGRISADEYYSITGAYPVGYTPPGFGGGYEGINWAGYVTGRPGASPGYENSGIYKTY